MKRMVLGTAFLAACGSGDGKGEGIETLGNVEHTPLTAGDSLVVGRATMEAGPLPEPSGGPSILSVERNEVGIPDSAAAWTVTLDAPADAVLMQFDDEDTVHRFEADGTEARLVFHYRGEVRDAWQDRFASSRDRFCDGNRFVVPDDIPANSRYTDYYDTLGSILDLLCNRGQFDDGGYVDEQSLNMLFPKRATGPVSLVAVSGDSAGEVWSTDQAVQRVKGNPWVASLFFDVSMDLDLHVVEPGGAKVYYAEPTSDAGGALNLDSNPGCSLDNVNNEHIGWADAPAGTYSVRVNYYAVCSQEPVNFIVSTVDEDTIDLYEGTLQPSHETRTFEITKWTVE
jgi:hypothetical protein